MYIQVFILPSSPKRTKTLESTKSENNCCSTNFDNYNNVFESETGDQSSESATTDRGSCGMRLDLSVHNEEGGFSPVVVVIPQQQQQVPNTVMGNQNRGSLKMTCPGSGSPARRTHAIREEEEELVPTTPTSFAEHTDRVDSEQLPVSPNNGQCSTPTTPLCKLLLKI